jgi:hypothetical protein
VPDRFNAIVRRMPPIWVRESRRAPLNRGGGAADD